MITQIGWILLGWIICCLVFMLGYYIGYSFGLLANNTFYEKFYKIDRMEKRSK